MSEQESDHCLPQITTSFPGLSSSRPPEDGGTGRTGTLGISLGRIGHFRVAVSLVMKARLGAQLFV